MSNQRPPNDVPEFDIRDDENPAEFHGEIEFAQRFTKEFGDNFIYTRGLGWLSWDGHRWKECTTGAPLRAVKALIKRELRKLVELTSEDRAKRFREVTRMESSRNTEGILKLAQAYLPCAVADEDLDQYPELLNTQSGVVDLETGEVAEPNPALLLTKVTNTTFDPDATSEVFDSFIERILPNPNVRAFVQRHLGSALLGEVRDHHLVIWNGEGRNGKDTLSRAVMNAVGDYAAEVSTKLLLEQKSDANQPEMMRLRGTRMAFSSETDRGRRFAEATMKKLTGGGKVTGRFLFKNEVEFDPSHSLVLLTNHLPIVSGDDPAVWARMVVVPFEVVIPEEERDGTLPAKLAAASEAIMAWVYLGWVDYQCKGLAIPDEVRQRTAEYREDSDALGRFLESRCTRGDYVSVHANQLFATWQAWCETEGVPSGTQTAFGKEMARRGLPSEKVNGRAVYKRIALMSEQDEVNDSGNVRRMNRSN